MEWLGDFPEDFAAVTCMFTTHAASGAPVAPLSAFEAADVLIYKNGNAAQKTTTNGVTMTSPFDSVTGLHCLTIDTSNDTGDSGFWVPGAVYTLVLSPDSETVDGVTVAKVIGQFGIDLAGAASTMTAAGIRAAVGLSAANLDTQLGAIDDAIDTEVGAIKAKTDNLPSDPADASVVAGLIAAVETKVDTVDTVVDAIKTKTDGLTFTVAGQVDANIQYVNDTEVAGDGETGTEWGPA
jgi:hypothetical protein